MDALIDGPEFALSALWDHIAKQSVYGWGMAPTKYLRFTPANRAFSKTSQTTIEESSSRGIFTRN